MRIEITDHPAPAMEVDNHRATGRRSGEIGPQRHPGPRKIHRADGRVRCHIERLTQTKIPLPHLRRRKVRHVRAFLRRQKIQHDLCFGKDNRIAHFLPAASCCFSTRALSAT